MSFTTTFNENFHYYYYYYYLLNIPNLELCTLKRLGRSHFTFLIILIEFLEFFFLIIYSFKKRELNKIF